MECMWYTSNCTSAPSSIFKLQQNSEEQRVRVMIMKSCAKFAIVQRVSTIGAHLDNFRV